MSVDQITSMAARLQTLFEERMRLKGKSLDAQVHKARPRLPRRIFRDAQVVIRAVDMVGNPKLERQVDVRATADAARRVEVHLLEIDPRDELKGKVLTVLGKVSAFVIIVFIVTIWILYQRGAI